MKTETTLNEAAQEAERLAQDAGSLSQLEEVRRSVLGRDSVVNRAAKSIKELPADERPAFGRAVKEARQQIEACLDARAEALKQVSGGAAEPADGIDVTLPGRRSPAGTLHPITATAHKLIETLVGLGFSYDDYPEVETEHYNFDALNTPDWHPARDMHDSLYTTGGRVMRTHTSAFQTRVMLREKTPPIRAMTFGRCYRNDQKDATHMPVFHQLDAIAIDRDISFADLKWTLLSLARTLFGPDAELRFRPSFFPFTTPSAEVDVTTPTGWMEILGAGMIRPEVLRHGGLDPQEWRGFAFGIGVDRVAMKRHQITNIRDMYDSDEAFLRQF